MLEKTFQEITNVYFDNDIPGKLRSIHFQVGGMKCYILLQYEDNVIMPNHVYHFKVNVVCPFCENHVTGLGPCFIFGYPKDDLYKLFHFLINYPTIRLKLISLGITPIVKLEQKKT